VTKQGWISSDVRRLADNPGEAILRAEAEAVAAENASLRGEFLALNNVVLYLDLAVFPEVDLRVVRHGTALAGLVLLLWGLVWDAE